MMSYYTLRRRAVNRYEIAIQLAGIITYRDDRIMFPMVV